MSSIAPDARLSDGPAGPRLGRRAVLATLAGSSGALIAARAAAAAPAAVDEADGLPAVSLADLRALTGAVADVYFVIDPGQTGIFRKDASDTTTPDNTGTVVVTADGVRFARDLDGAVDVRWFGAQGDGISDDADPIQAAVDAAQQLAPTFNPAVGLGHFGVYLPRGVYRISKPIVVNTVAAAGLRIFGDGPTTTIVASFQGHDVIDALFAVNAGAVGADYPTKNQYEFSGLFLWASTTAAGVPNVARGIDAANVKRSVFRDLKLNSFGTAGIRIRWSWANVIDRCAFVQSGQAVEVGPEEVNALNVVDSYFGQNDIGLHLAAAPTQQVRVAGCTFEGHSSPAIVVAGDVKALDVCGNYFELNHREPYQFAGVSEPVYADIAIAPGVDAGPVRIASNHVWIQQPWDVDCHVVAAYASRGGLDISGTHVMHHQAHTGGSGILRTGTSQTGSGALVERLRISSTYVEWQAGVQGPFSTVRVDDLAGGATALADAVIDGVVPTDYADPLVRFHVVERQPAVGQFVQTSQMYRGAPVWELRGAADTSTWGFELDVDAHPELAGRYVYIACWARATEADTGIVLSTSALGPSTSDYLPDTQWHVVSYVDQLPQSGSAAFGVAKISASATSAVQVARVVVSEVGAPYAGYHG
jgi:hypothetical protein